MRNNVERYQISLTVYITQDTPTCGLLGNDIGLQMYVTYGITLYIMVNVVVLARLPVHVQHKLTN